MYHYNVVLRFKIIPQKFMLETVLVILSKKFILYVQKKSHGAVKFHCYWEDKEAKYVGDFVS